MPHVLSISFRLFEKKVRQRRNFRLVLDEFEFVNVSYWYIPPSMLGQEETEQWKEKLHKVRRNQLQQINKVNRQPGVIKIGPEDFKNWA